MWAIDCFLSWSLEHHRLLPHDEHEAAVVAANAVTRVGVIHAQLTRGDGSLFVGLRSAKHDDDLDAFVAVPGDVRARPVLEERRRCAVDAVTKDAPDIHSGVKRLPGDRRELEKIHARSIASLDRCVGCVGGACLHGRVWLRVAEGNAVAGANVVVNGCERP